MRWKIPSFLSYEKASKNQECENVRLKKKSAKWWKKENRINNKIEKMELINEIKNMINKQD